MGKHKISNKICKKAKIWYNSSEACCKLMKNNLKHFILFLFVIAVAFAYNVTAKEFKEGHLYRTILGPPQLAMEKPAIESPRKALEKPEESINNRYRKGNNFFEKRFLLNANKVNSKEKKDRNKTKIKSSSLKQKRYSRKTAKHSKIDFKDKNGDGYDDRHKADDL